MTNSPIKIIVGLGNIGDGYAQTRHNVGWWLLDKVLEKFYSQTPWQKQTKFNGVISKIQINNQIIFLLKPSTYMNNSGISVKAVCSFYKILPHEILVIHDELDIAAGVLKLKIGGSAGGHNGLKSIDSQLGTNKYWRLRLGINHPRNSHLPTIQNQSVSDYVLHAPSKEDYKLINNCIDKAINNITALATGDMEKAMMILHTN